MPRSATSTYATAPTATVGSILRPAIHRARQFRQSVVGFATARHAFRTSGWDGVATSVGRLPEARMFLQATRQHEPARCAQARRVLARAFSRRLTGAGRRSARSTLAQ